MASTPWVSDFTQRLSERFGSSISEFATYLGQNFLMADPSIIVNLLHYLRVEEDFDYLVDITAVDYPAREDRFDIIYVLYSFSSNERIRIKTRIQDGATPDTVTGVHATADWLEREVFDMFGIEFKNHPNMKRILMPDEWNGYPLRKDYSIIQMDNQWVKENLQIESGQ
jgi:NADH-quinone oxidoreductase subunit C